jgi:glycine cleavage system H protein
MSEDSNHSYDIPDGYSYTKDHEWAQRKADGNVLIGITDYAAKMLHDIVYVTLPKAGEDLSRGSVLGQVESVKTVSDIYAPLSGKVLKSNDRLAKEPEIVSSSPYHNGWMVEVEASNFENESRELLNGEEYRKYILELAEKEI